MIYHIYLCYWWDLTSNDMTIVESRNTFVQTFGILAAHPLSFAASRGLLRSHGHAQKISCSSAKSIHLSLAFALCAAAPWFFFVFGEALGGMICRLLVLICCFVDTRAVRFDAQSFEEADENLGTEEFFHVKVAVVVFPVLTPLGSFSLIC